MIYPFLCYYKIMNFRNLISINIIAALGIMVTLFCVIEFLPLRECFHLSLVEIGYILTIIYLLMLMMFVIFAIEIVLNIFLSLKYVQSNLIKNTLAHNIFLILGLLMSFYFLLLIHT